MRVEKKSSCTKLFCRAFTPNPILLFVHMPFLNTNCICKTLITTARTATSIHFFFSFAPCFSFWPIFFVWRSCLLKATVTSSTSCWRRSSRRWPHLRLTRSALTSSRKPWVMAPLPSFLFNPVHFTSWPCHVFLFLYYSLFFIILTHSALTLTSFQSDVCHHLPAVHEVFE